MDTAFVLARIGLALVFAVAGVAKLLDLAGSRQALVDFGVPRRLAAPGAVLLPVAEVITAAILLFGATARWGAFAAFILLAGFVFGLSRALYRGHAPDCHCFGQLHSEPAGKATVARNVALAVPAAWLAWEGPGPELGTWTEGRDGQELALVAVSALAAVLALATAALWRENRRLRADALPWTPPIPLALGAPAPPFALPDPEGRTVSLDALLAPGRLCVLAFVQPGCGPCDTVLPDLARWQRSLAERLTLRVVTSGDLDEQRRLAEKHGLAGVLRQRGDEVSEAYRVPGTPCAILVGADGKIASAPAAGVPAIEGMVRSALHDESAPPRLEVQHVG